MKKIICWAALVLALCLPVCALAATEPNTRTIEDTTTYEGETIQITIDQWCYAFNRTSLRFFVANVYVDDPAQLQTAFAGEEYSKSNSEATSAIAERHDAILAVNGDYYNYKDKNGLVIRNGVLYRDEASTRDQLLIMNDGTFVALPRGTYNAGEPVTHDGIFVGNGMMIHCGNPIQYASIDSSYWSSHFYAFGRLGGG